MIYDYIIIGGGIIGLSTALQLQQRIPKSKILLLEKETDLATHQTGHNSGVIHAGVYYQPGSLKAKFCREGLRSTLLFCQQYNIPYQQCGKLLVATNEAELQRMSALSLRCEQNGIETEPLDEQQLIDAEPNISGLAAILVRATGIVDYQRVAQEMARQFCAAGGKIQLASKAIKLSESTQNIQVMTKTANYKANFLIACAGLMADRLAKQLDISIDFQIIPFRGEYYRLPSSFNSFIRHLIYPIPDPTLPFLGVHLTRMINGGISVGPNAVIGWKREGYQKMSFDPSDTLEMLLFKGFWSNLKNNIKPGFKELKNSIFKCAYLRQVHKYCPRLNIENLLPYPAGIRAQAVMSDGSLAQDFLFAESKRSLHVCNAPSPAATSAIPIGSYICDKVAGEL